jgi:hypothetical protein
VATPERVNELGRLELLAIRLPTLVGPGRRQTPYAKISGSGIAVEPWLDILERLMFTYHVLPFRPPRMKAVKGRKQCHSMFDECAWSSARWQIAR